jgi:hypothetical protein
MSRFCDELPREVIEEINPAGNSSPSFAKPTPMDDQLLNDFLSGKINIDEFLDS